MVVSTHQSFDKGQGNGASPARYRQPPQHETTALAPAQAGVRWGRCFDRVLSEHGHKTINDFVNRPGWTWGWQSAPGRDRYSFWHKHYAGARSTDHDMPGHRAKQYDCAAELQGNAPLLHEMWTYLHRHALPGHVLTRCYANAYPYGSDGTVHTDSIAANGFTSIYYPNPEWYPDWGGETLFFDERMTDVIGAVYPKPNRLFVFSGRVPHRASGVSRSCPALRITLMFKSEHTGPSTGSG